MKSFAELRQHAGNAALFQAVQLSLIGAIRGKPLHLHAQGMRGTGKTTLLRAAGALLPPIVRISGCLYNCDPAHPHCPQHADVGRGEAGLDQLETVPGPFLELSHSTKLSTAVGSIDLQRLVGCEKPSAALLPGLIPQANRGILFVDEVNRLADTAPELTDMLLDVMGTKPGRVQVEDAGLPVITVPSSTTVWAASNPDEDPGSLAEIRRQLSDRFDLVVTVERPRDPESVAAILAAATQPEKAAPRSCIRHNAQYLGNLRAQLSRAADRVEEVAIPELILETIASIYCQFELESLRAAEGLATAAVYACALRGADRVTQSDLATVLPLVLKHRLTPDDLAAVSSFIATGRDTRALREPGAVRGLHRARRLVDLPPQGWYSPEEDLR